MANPPSNLNNLTGPGVTKGPPLMATIKTFSLADLEGFPFAKLNKDGSYTPLRKRKKASHKIETTKLGTITIPLKRWPKHKTNGYGKPRYDMQVPITSENKLEIPTGATHLEYSTSRMAIISVIKHVNDFTHMRGQLRFGILKPNDRFEYLDEGTELKDGTCVMMKAPVTRIVREEPEPIAPTPPKGSKAAKTQAAAPAAPKAPSKPVAKPSGTGAVARVWAVCDELYAASKTCPAKADVIAKLHDLNAGTVATQHSAWRRHNGIPKA